MATRPRPSEHRRRLVADLRAACLDGSLRPGDPLPPARELQAKYGLSPASVVAVIGELAEEGLVYSIPRTGTFVADGVVAEQRVFAMTVGTPDTRHVTPFIDRIRRGFEDEVARSGGSSLVLPLEEFQEAVRAGRMPPLSGVFVSTSSPDLELDTLVTTDGPPVVRLWQEIDTVPPGRECDLVQLDNVDGGRRAAQYLARHGHRRIAFLGYDGTADPWYHNWSELRAQGWREVMAGLEQSTDGMEFTIPVEEESDEVTVAQQVSAALIPRRDITGVVCANDHAVIGLVAALEEHAVPPAGWPAMIGFDGRAEAGRHVVTSLRLPWEGLGARAADLLFERMTGRLSGPGQRHLLPMEVTSRVGLTELSRIDVRSTL